MRTASVFLKQEWELHRKFADQLLAASNSYVILLAPLLKRDFSLLGEISTLTGLYVFWLGVIRIYLVNEIIRLGDRRNSFSHYSIRGFKAGLSALPLLLLGGVFHTSELTLVLTVLLITSGIQEEILRQYFISHNDSIKALLVDGMWFIGMLIGIVIICFLDTNQIEYYLFATSFTCIVATSLGYILLIQSKYSKSESQEKNTISVIVTVIPVFMAIHTVSFNLIFSFFHEQFNLGLLRGISLLFLPAIFLINIQASYFRFSDAGGKATIKLELPSFKKIFLVAVLMGMLCANFYLSFSANFTIEKFMITIIVAGSMIVNYSINLKTLKMINMQSFRRLIFSRAVWCLSAVSLMYLLVAHFLLLIAILLLLDIVLNSYLGRFQCKDYPIV
jgi:hypothetical protein